MAKEILVAKQAIVDEVSAKIKNSSSLVIAEYRGLTVAEVTELRKELRAEGVDFKVYKNKLVKRATDENGLEALDEYLTGPNAIAFGGEDAVAPARVLAKFARKHPNLVLKSGMVEGQILNLEELKAISKLPDRKGMYAMLLGCLQAPMAKMARTVQALVDARTGGAPAEEAAPAE